MSTLPASVRLALWATYAYAGHVDLSEAVRRALPDLDFVDGALEPLQLWADLGEQVVCVALPRPGQIATMPLSDGELTKAATVAGECVFVPALGGALVPTIDVFGPEGDTGWQATWQRFDAAPVPVHQLAALDAREIDRSLRAHVLDLTQELNSLDVTPWAGSSLRQEADDRSAVTTWGLPPGLPAPSLRAIILAGTLAAAAEFGLEQPPSLDVTSHARRERLLRDLLAVAETALAGAATAAAQSIAGLRHTRS
ncbi:hypothetical protein [Demetria terragena]|uniref:hypothetical protein n=1 Tax=Demetria terragena TaxID=63959 RepID=UPI0003743C20|nr:hypothetical protein [Demetria terragena]